MIETSLRNWLLNKPAILSQLKGSGNSPVFVDDADQDAREYLLIESDGTEDTSDLGDFDPDDLIDETVSVTVKCETAGKAASICQQLLSSGLPNLSGVVSDRFVEGCWIVGVESDYEPPDAGESKGKHLKIISLQIHHRTK